MKNEITNPATDNAGTGNDSQNQKLVTVVTNRHFLRHMGEKHYLQMFAELKGINSEDISQDLSEFLPTDPDLVTVLMRIQQMATNCGIGTWVDLVYLPVGTRFILAQFQCEDMDYSWEQLIILNDDTVIFTA